MGEHSGWGLNSGSPGSAGAGGVWEGHVGPEPAGAGGPESGPVDVDVEVVRGWGVVLELTESGARSPVPPLPSPE